MGQRCNAREVSRRLRVGALRGSASQTVLAVAAAALLSMPAWADINAGSSANMSTLGSGATLNGGTIKIDGSATYGGNIQLNDVATNTIDINGQTATLGGKFAGAGGIIFANTGSGGVLTLSNTNITYTGATVINSGATLALTADATIATSSALTVNGTFDISGTNTGATITSLSGTGNITLGSLLLTVSDGATGANYGGVISGTGSIILTSGTETFTGVSTYTGSTTVSSGTLTLTGAGSIAQSASVLVYGTLDMSAASSATLKSLSGSGTVVLGTHDLELTNASGSFSGTITGTGRLILDAGTQWIGGNTSFSSVVISGGTLEVGSTTVAYNIANSGSFDFYNSDALTMTGVISGTGAVYKYGSGIATISSVQTYTGATTISGGTILLSGNGSIASSSGVQVDSVLDLTTANDAHIKALTGLGTVRLGTQPLTITNGSGDFSGSITGTGIVTIAGGTQSLSGTNTYTGATNVNSGAKLILVVGSSLKSAVELGNTANMEISAGALTSGAVTVSSLGGAGAVNLNGNSLTLSAASDAYNGVISGTGNLWIAGGSETLGGDNTYTGTTTVAAGTLTLTGRLSAASKLAVNGTLDVSGAADPSLTFVSLTGSGAVVLGDNNLVLNTAAGGSTIFSGVISGSGGLTVQGAGTEILSGENTYVGGTTIVSGAMLQIGSGTSTGTIKGNVTDNGTLRFYRLDKNFFNNVVSGAGAVVQGGIGTTVLTADNTYNGGTTITSGTLQIGDASVNGGHSGSIQGNVVDNGTLAFGRTDAVVITTSISGTGNLSVLSGQVTLTGISSYSGDTRIASGATLALTGAANIASSYRVNIDGTLDVSGMGSDPTLKSLAGGSTGAVVLGSRNLTLTAATDSFAGTISGTGDITLTGGTQGLSGTNTGYTGTTTISGGTLSVTGSIANSAVTVNSTGTLSGTGTVGSVMVNSGGTLRSGASGTGILHVNGAVDLAGGSIYAVDMTSAGAAQMAATGNITINGALAITSSDGTYDLGKPLTIVTGNSITGTFATSSVDLFSAANGSVFTSKVSYTGTAVTLEVDLAKLSTALATGATANQKAVAGGIDKAIAKGTIPAGFEILANQTASALSADATELSGEIGADAPLAASGLFNPFLDAMSARIGMLRPLAKGQTRPLETWISAYGGTNVVDGDDVTGASKFRSDVAGVVAGAQWMPWTNTLIGGAISAGRSDFHLSGDLGKGNATTIAAGVYGYVQASRHIYNSFEAAASLTQIKTTRVLTVSDTDTLSGKVNAYTFGGRYEAGLQLAWFTPYIGVQDHVSMLPSYSEGVAGGTATYALNYASRTYNSGRVEVGLRHFIDVEVTPRWILTPDFTLHLNDRLAYAHDLSDGSQADVAFNTLPSSGFSVYGAKGKRDAAIGTLGADVLFNNGLRITTQVDAAVSQRSQSFTGFAGIGYTW